MKTITQPASHTFINCCSDFDLSGPELCRLEFDPNNDTVIADRIYLVSTGELLWGQLELPLNIENPNLIIKSLSL